MANENQVSNQPKTPTPSHPAPKPIPPIKPDPSTMGVCQKKRKPNAETANKGEK